METRLEELQGLLDTVNGGGGPKYVERHRQRGKLLPRERIELLLDRDSPFLELQPYMAWHTDFHVGASMVAGIGVVEGVECVITASDPTVRGGTSNPYTLRKALRAQDVALVNRLPFVQLTESGGADLPTQADAFIPGGATFRNLTRLSAHGIPTVALVFGSSTAGGAYIPGMSDYTVFVEGRAKVFLGGPPLVKMATGEESGDEELGGAEMHARTSGLADHLATDEHDAIRIGREIVANLNWRKRGPGPAAVPEDPLHDPEDLVALPSADPKVPFDTREVLARVLDGSRYDEFKPLYGPSLTTGWGQVHGYRVGVLANVRGILFSEEAQKAAQFIQLANQKDVPLLFLHNTTGFMVGKDYEQGGIIKDGAKMINAVSNSRVPHLGVVIGGSYGAANYAMSGRGYDPRFIFSWPNAQSSVMGPAQLAGVLSIVMRAGAEARGVDYDEEADAQMRSAVEAQIEGEQTALANSSRGYDDGIIDPRDTRTVLGLALSAVHNAEVKGAEGFGVFPHVMQRVLVANRGEIARRIFATCRRLGISTAAVFSDPDAGAPFAREADVAVALGGAAPADSYLRADLILDAARRAGADAIHPGYGFLAENAGFARQVLDAGLVWIGPSPEAIDAMGSKTEARTRMERAGVPVLPGSYDVSDAAAVGFPLLVKASAGGGGKGMRLVEDRSRLAGAVAAAQREAASAFGDDTVFLERYAAGARHVEVQILGDRHGRVVALHERDCSVQRRHQKVIEEAPSPAVDDALRARLAEAAVRAGEAIGYEGAGTVEFLLTDAREFFFLEVNTRLQVEHPVTELVTGLDLVEQQLRVAEGGTVPEVPPLRGHAIEARLYAEDPARDFLPVTGTLARFHVPGDVRVDTGVEDGSAISPYYDPMVAKVVAHGATRAEAARKLADALARAEVQGTVTNRDFLVRVLRHPEFLGGTADTGFLDRTDAAALAAPLLDRDAVGHAALAAALAGQAARRATAAVQGTLPSGWRNNPALAQRATFRTPYDDELEVTYRFARDGRLAEPAGVIVHHATATAVDLTVDGLRRTYRVGPHAVGTADGEVALTEVPRFTDPTAVLAAGSLTSPMPGAVLRVLAEAGADVARGQALLVLEAMKMEHEIVAPADGTLTELPVAAGDQVEAGTVLAVIAGPED